MAKHVSQNIQRRKSSKSKAGTLSAANLRLIRKTAEKVSNHALRSALLRLMAHQEQLKLLF